MKNLTKNIEKFIEERAKKREGEYEKRFNLTNSNLAQVLLKSVIESLSNGFCLKRHVTDINKIFQKNCSLTTIDLNDPIYQGLRTYMIIHLHSIIVRVCEKNVASFILKEKDVYHSNKNS